MLRAWLRGRVAAECDIDDVVQESYLRIWQALETTAIALPKAFLFAIARNVALGRVRRHKVSREISVAEVDVLGVSDESADVHQAVARAQELEILKEAIASLPDRCRQILTLRKLYGLSQKEVAAQLGIAEHTVEAQGVIGLRKVIKFFEHWRSPRVC